MTIETIDRRQTVRRRASLAIGLVGTLINLGRAFESRQRDILAASGLTVREHDVLQLIASGEPASQRDICLRLDMDSSSVSQIVVALHLRGLIEPLAVRGRKRSYRETSLGREIRETLDESLATFASAVADTMSSATQTELPVLAKRLMP